MGRRWWFVGAVGVSVTPVIAARVGWPGAVPVVASALSLFWITGAAVFDMVWRLLPDTFVLLAGLPVAMAAAVHPHGSSTALPGIGVGALVWSGPLLAAHLVAPDELGFGDAKVAAVLGATLGLTLSAMAVAAALVVALGAASSAGLRTRRGTIALGPYLVLGAVVALVCARLAKEFS